MVQCKIEDNVVYLKKWKETLQYLENLKKNKKKSQICLEQNGLHFEQLKFWECKSILVNFKFF